MSTTINVICYKSKVLKNSESPLMIRVCKDRKSKYLALGVSINPEFWDFNKNKPKPKCPNKELIETLIAEKTRMLSEKVIELKVIDKEFSASSLIEKINKPLKTKTVDETFQELILKLSTENRHGYMLSVKQVYNSLIKFNKHLNIYFSDIDVSWLKRYETWLRGQGIKENTIGIRFRTLRVVYNIAMEENIVKSEYYPFKNYKVSKLHQQTAKRAITKEQVNQIIQYKSNNGYVKLAIDLFTFSYLMGGINFVDIAYLNNENLHDNKLVYTRRKTGKLIKLPLQDKAIEIIEKYRNAHNSFLFPILSHLHYTEQQRANRVHKVITKVNCKLKEIGKELQIPIDLTTYVARHSFATVLKRAGVNTSLICESLGHSSEKVTQVYLDSFDNEQINQAMKNLI